MAASIPDTSAIQHLGSQFTHNIFAGAQRNLNTKSKKFAEQHVSNVKTAQANRDKFAASAAQGIKQGRTAFAKGQQQQAKQAANTAKAHAAGVKSGKVAPAPGAPPRTFAMGTTPQQKAQTKTMKQQMNFAHGQALTFQAAQFKTQQQQRNYAHGQAIQQQNQMTKQQGKGTVTAPAAPKLTPGFSSPTPTHTPVKALSLTSATFSHQLSPQKPQGGPQGSTGASFSHGSTPSTPAPVAGSLTSSQFSAHEHPAGSSTTPLPTLTASQPKPNTFTTGSRNARPGGIAARGSQLEAWAQSKSSAVQARRASANAGGRDKGLASSAKTAENIAKQPLSKFTE